ncbi:response regulator [Pseudobacteriovorax antillogorgiicola]|uniref:PilZ domain-containing protein n=1 Tax=Pseudobacteriovorax antillogorgiicola TaxID=1513793 RepID=A0A1Y6BF51_9BACT|nr:response regulator [Pseudobacteriovorax antillogorgiicola]TCS57417.1 PilZ domain-containing protein [Pseudobacteriovorax antillogorgiicola]SMF01400.1 PilZ domain-containing protein [Pseudobacteriovorax antillogorgiicola]
MSKILVVDDVVQMQELVIQIAETQGIKGHGVSNSRKALQFLQDVDDISLIFLDINLEGESGFSLCKRIRAEPELADTKICFISGHREKQYVLKALSEGGNDYLIKPIDPLSVIEKLNRFVKNNSSSQFVWCDASLVAIPQGFPFKLELHVHKISEGGLKLTSPIEFEKSAVFDLELPYFSRKKGEGCLFTCEITHCKKQKQSYNVDVNFVGISENFAQMIREETVKQVPLED